MRDVNRRLWTAASVAAFIATVLAWSWLADQHLAPRVTALLLVGPPLLIVPAVLVARRILDAAPTAERAVKVSRVLHAWLMFFFGMSVIAAALTADAWRGPVLPVPHVVAAVLVYATGAFGVLTVANLALRGFGAPFAISLSRRLATDWLYSRTRNPMVLAFLAFLAAVGLWHQSALFVLWDLALVSPILLFYVKHYEERELEIRFGEPYRRYRASTPFLWPGKPRA